MYYPSNQENLRQIMILSKYGNQQSLYLQEVPFVNLTFNSGIAHRNSLFDKHTVLTGCNGNLSEKNYSLSSMLFEFVVGLQRFHSLICLHQISVKYCPKSINFQKISMNQIKKIKIKIVRISYMYVQCIIQPMWTYVYDVCRFLNEK